MDIWTIPLIIVVLIILLISMLTVRKGQKVKQFVKGQDEAVHEPIEEHPFVISPIIWMIIVATTFIFIVIFYYWSTSF